MIPYVDTQLSIWGKWSVARSLRGVGFSPICPMFKQDRYCGGFGSAVPVGVSIDAEENVIDTDKAVERLTQEQKRLCVEFYVIGGSGVEVSRRLAMPKRTMYDKLHGLHQAVLGHINDVVAGC